MSWLWFSASSVVFIFFAFSLMTSLRAKSIKAKKLDKSTVFKNLQFYKNEIPSEPSGDLISVIHDTWASDHAKLEYHHGYIQWLFPLYEGKGMNHLASGLKKPEAKLMRENVLVGENVMKSYEMMLDFYGMRLYDKKTGEVRRSKKWKSRYRNLNLHGHNNLRISRILASLGHLGFWRWKVGWINFLEKEIYEKKELGNCKRSFKDFWVKLRDIEKPDEEEFLDSVYYKKHFANSEPEENEDSAEQEQEDITKEDSLKGTASDIEVETCTQTEIEENDCECSEGSDMEED